MIRRRSRALLAVAVLLGVALIALRLEMANDDWSRCFNSEANISLREPAVARTVEMVGTAIFLLAQVVPALLVIALARGLALPLVAVAPLAFVVVVIATWDVADMHHCDRKGVNSAEAVAILMVVVQLPLSVLVLMGLGVRRLIKVLKPVIGRSAQ